MDFKKEFLVKPDSKVKLADIDPASHGSYTEEDANAELAKHKETISVLQRRLNAEATRAMLIVLQGIDRPEKTGRSGM